MARAIDAVIGTPWAIQPHFLAGIAAVAQRHFDDPAAVGMRGPPRQGEPGLNVVDGVAVLGVIGPIFPRANMMTEHSGATSLEKLQADFRAAMADPAVKSILLNIDSPGGVVSGIGDFAAEVAAARKIKPVTAYAGGTVASAAYWIASAASRLVVSATSVVGSIGVVVAASKQVAPDANGEITVEIVSTNAPEKRTDPTDSAGRASVVKLLDSLEAQFVGAVARHRGVSVETVKSDFGRGGVVVGAEAVAAGMADAVASFEAVLTTMAAAVVVINHNPRGAAAPVVENVTMNDPTSVAELTAAFPDLVGQIRREASATASSDAANDARTDGYAAGVAAERERITALEDMALPGHEALIAAFKADGTSPDVAAKAILKAEKETGGRKLAAIAADGAVAVPVAAAAAPAAAKTSDAIMADKSRTVEARCTEAHAMDENIRAAFPRVETFIAYQSAVEAGKVRVFGGGKI